RRARQNAGGGTDHGTANNVFLMGGQLRQTGLYNPGPDLSRLQDDDLMFDIDFRRIYATVLDRWLEADAAQILQGRFELLGCV
ncbi:MAG TPA: twin-arginine translocation pathway signal, partial [Saprospiraceae bacterium]|nr:twin-arginine translocation pathway signal [Saprospiraceae bacterium]